MIKAARIPKLYHDGWLKVAGKHSALTMVELRPPHDGEWRSEAMIGESPVARFGERATG